MLLAVLAIHNVKGQIIPELETLCEDPSDYLPTEFEDMDPLDDNEKEINVQNLKFFMFDILKTDPNKTTKMQMIYRMCGLDANDKVKDFRVSLVNVYDNLVKKRQEIQEFFAKMISNFNAVSEFESKNEDKFFISLEKVFYMGKWTKKYSGMREKEMPPISFQRLTKGNKVPLIFMFEYFDFSLNEYKEMIRQGVWRPSINIYLRIYKAILQGLIAIYENFTLNELTGDSIVFIKVEKDVADRVSKNLNYPLLELFPGQYFVLKFFNVNNLYIGPPDERFGEFTSFDFNEPKRKFRDMDNLSHRKDLYDLAMIILSEQFHLLGFPKYNKMNAYVTALSFDDEGAEAFWHNKKMQVYYNKVQKVWKNEEANKKITRDTQQIYYYKKDFFIANFTMYNVENETNLQENRFLNAQIYKQKGFFHILHEATGFNVLEHSKELFFHAAMMSALTYIWEGHLKDANKEFIKNKYKARLGRLSDKIEERNNGGDKDTITNQTQKYINDAIDMVDNEYGLRLELVQKMTRLMAYEISQDVLEEIQNTLNVIDSKLTKFEKDYNPKLDYNKQFDIHYVSKIIENKDEDMTLMNYKFSDYVRILI